MAYDQLQSTLPRDLGDNLVLRRSTPADAERLATFNARIHEDELVGGWTRDLLRGGHPTFGTGDFLVVEDTQTHEIVSSSCLISQTWTYEGIPFGVGRPELIGTDAAYRKRGLVRAQMDEMHAWSSQRGQVLQGITGIPFYYRQFGYEMTVELGGQRKGFESNLPVLAEGQTEPYRLRPAEESDLEWIAALYQQGSQRYVLSCFRDAALWRHELSGFSPQNIERFELRVIEDEHGRTVGFLAHPAFLWTDALAATTYELLSGVSWTAVTPSVLRYLWNTGQEYGRAANKPCRAYVLGLGSEHPAYDALTERLPVARPPYAWYLRVPDLAGFLRLITPALEKRLGESLCCGFTGELSLSFYRSGLALVFEGGHLTGVRDYPEDWGKAAATFPGLTFLQLLFGYRSLAELRYAFVDCTGNEQARPLLEALFPKKTSQVWPIS